MRTPTILAALALLLGPAAASPAPAAACHCFRDREFDPAKPGAADPYILATTRSSLLSAAFGVGKGELVRAVMSGTAPEDLWIAHWAAARLRRPADALLEARDGKGSWRAALAGLGSLGERFDAALARGASDAELAAVAVDDVLVARVRADAAAVRAIRGAGATTEETVVATVLSATIGAPVLPLVAEVRAGRATWGSILAQAGVEPARLDATVRALVQ